MERPQWSAFAEVDSDDDSSTSESACESSTESYQTPKRAAAHQSLSDSILRVRGSLQLVRERLGSTPTSLPSRSAEESRFQQPARIVPRGCSRPCWHNDSNPVRSRGALCPPSIAMTCSMMVERPFEPNDAATVYYSASSPNRRSPSIHCVTVPSFQGFDSGVPQGVESAYLSSAHSLMTRIMQLHQSCAHETKTPSSSDSLQCGREWLESVRHYYLSAIRDRSRYGMYRRQKRSRDRDAPSEDTGSIASPVNCDAPDDSYLDPIPRDDEEHWTRKERKCRALGGFHLLQAVLVAMDA